MGKKEIRDGGKVEEKKGKMNENEESGKKWERKKKRKNVENKEWKGKKR